MTSSWGGPNGRQTNGQEDGQACRQEGEQTSRQESEQTSRQESEQACRKKETLWKKEAQRDGKHGGPTEVSDGLMTLSDARDGYYVHSGKASDIARQLAFAGIAIIWIFKKDVNGMPTIGSSFIPATKWFIVTLGADLLQYVCAATAWGLFARWKERQPGVDAETEFDAPSWLNWPGNAFFVTKIVCVTVAYSALSCQIWSLIQSPVTELPVAPGDVKQTPAHD